MSKYEQHIKEILKKQNVSYEVEKNFRGLQYCGSLLRFDFYIEYNNKKIIIEVDGEFHFYPITHFGDTSKFHHMQENDRRKNKYCILNKIPLYRIPYWDIDKINQIEDVFQDKYKVKSMWHNDQIIKEKYRQN